MSIELNASEGNLAYFDVKNELSEIQINELTNRLTGSENNAGMICICYNADSSSREKIFYVKKSDSGISYSEECDRSVKEQSNGTKDVFIKFML